MNRRETGALGEELARDFLEKRGYRIIETNYRCPEGEIDIMAIELGDRGNLSRIEQIENAVGGD